MPLIIGGGLALGGLVGNAVSGGKAASASQNIATSQMQQAQAWRTQSLAYAQPTAAELDNITKQNSLAMNALNYSQQQLGVAKDTVQNAFKQQNQILNGETPAYLAPLQKQLGIDAQANQNRISAAFGRGASSSSAGIMANAQFSQNSAMTLMNAQQQALGTLSGIGANANSAVLGGFGAAEGANQAAFGMNNALENRITNASVGTNTTNYAGGQYAGDLMSAQSAQRMWGGLGGIGTGLALQGAFGPSMMGSGGSGAQGGFGAYSNLFGSQSNPGVGPYSLFNK